MSNRNKRRMKKLKAIRFKENDRSIKINKEGQECRHCDGKVIRKSHKLNFKPKPNQPYYFLYWFKCPKCRAQYMVEEAKVYLNPHAVVDVDTAFECAIAK